MKTYKIHPAAELWPMMSRPQLEELAADIKTNGQYHPVLLTTDGDMVIDGRNRLEACRMADVEPDVQYWDGEGSPVAFVLSMNHHRRHLNESQLALVAASSLPLLEQEALRRKRAGKKVETGRAHDWQVWTGGGGTTHECRVCGLEHHHAKGRTWAEPDHDCPGQPGAGTLAPRGAKVGTTAAPEPKKKGKAAELAAKAIGVSARSVERAKALLSKAPKAEIDKIREGKKTLKQVERETKRAEQVAQVRVYVPPVGEYAVIVTDVSWEYDDALDGSDGARGGMDYPAQKLDEILAMKIPAARNCALWFWVTNAFLIDGTAARVLAAWGFEPKGLLTWVKNHWGGGHYLRGQTEHVILAVRGHPVIVGNNQATFFEAPRTRVHSEKPDAFFEIAEKVTPCAPEARLEMNARKARPGWVGTGAELPKKRRTLLLPDGVSP